MYERIPRSRRYPRFARRSAEEKAPASFTTDRTLQALVADLVAARLAAGMTQEEVAAMYVDDEKRCFTSGSRRAYASDANDRREIRGRGRRLDRNPCADKTVARSAHLG